MFRLRKRAEIRRTIPRCGARDRIADLLEEAANKIEDLENHILELGEQDWRSP